MKNNADPTRQYRMPFLCLSLLFLSAMSVFAKAEEVQSFDIDSEVMQEKRAISVFIPKACEGESGNTACPVAYLLDADWYMNYLVTLSKEMSSRNQIPPLIVVGIHTQAKRMSDLTPSNALTDWTGKQRASFSSSGNGNNLLSFIDSELIPYIDNTYRPLPFRVFVGHSLAGLMVIQSMMTQPDVFQGYMAIDPSLWWDEKTTLKQYEKSLIHQNVALNGRLYLGSADHTALGNDGLIVMNTTAKRFASALKLSATEHFTYRFDTIADESHMTIPLPTFYLGLKYLFANYSQVPLNLVFAGPTAVENYYRTLWQTWGIALPVPKGKFAALGWMLYESGELSQAALYANHALEVSDGKSASAKLLLSEITQSEQNQETQPRQTK